MLERALTQGNIDSRQVLAEMKGALSLRHPALARDIDRVLEITLKQDLQR